MTVESRLEGLSVFLSAFLTVFSLTRVRSDHLSHFVIYQMVWQYIEPLATTYLTLGNSISTLNQGSINNFSKHLVHSTCSFFSPISDHLSPFYPNTLTYITTHIHIHTLYSNSHPYDSLHQLTSQDGQGDRLFVLFLLLIMTLVPNTYIVHNFSILRNCC